MTATFRRGGIAVFSISLAACGAAPSQPQAAGQPVVDVQPPAKSAPSSEASAAPGRVDLSGTYSSEHEVTYVCDKPDWCTQKVTDGLSVEQLPGKLKVKIELVQANYHVCNWEGEMTEGSGDRWEFSEPECELVLQVSPDTLSITSEGCREYCGARAYLQAKFPRPE